MTQQHIELIVRAVITDGQRLLLSQPAGATWYFLPGGHVEWGEPVTVALRRELEEELGLPNVEVSGVLSIIENRYRDEHGDHHEVNLIHLVVVDKAVDGSREAHLNVRWVERSELDRVEIRPTPLAEVLRSGLNGPDLKVRTNGFW
jgi:8-oxo-dGTP diphosphatase